MVEELADDTHMTYAFNVLLQNLRFGYGSAIAVIVFLDNSPAGNPDSGVNP